MSEFDPKTIDLSLLASELKKIREEVKSEITSDQNIKHLKKMEMWGKIASVLGYGTAWIAPNPISMFLINQGQHTRWLLMHHISHRGYDKVEGIPDKYTSKKFAKGNQFNRLRDWPEWMYPEAWHHEHDILHHWRTGEKLDPDLLESNIKFMEGWPKWKRAIYGVLLFSTWKWSYYAPNTMDVLCRVEERKKNIGKDKKKSLEDLIPGESRSKKVWINTILKCYIPILLYRFLAIPALFFPIGSWASLNVLINTIGAEIINNIHTGVVIIPNHTGDDIYAFKTEAKSREEFYLRQIIGSCNFNTGRDYIDWSQVWLNYQIEHHIWPDMTLLEYRAAQPKVKALCERMGIPYIQESVWKRLVKTKDIILGNTKMKWVDELV